HLEQLRAMAFTQGVSAALQTSNDDFLLEALYPLVVNAGLDALCVTDAHGREIISIILDSDTAQYAVIRGADLHDLDLVKKILEGEVDSLGDKYAGIIETGYGPYLATTVPVMDPDQNLAGALMLFTRLDHFLSQIKPQVLADLIMLDQSGTLLATTLAPPENGYQILELPVQIAEALYPALTLELSLYERAFQIYFSPLVVRQETLGVLGIALPSNFIVSVESTSRNLMTLIFTLGAMGVIIAGSLLACSIINPITRLRDVSLAVAGGDLQQRTGLSGRDEIGQLAAIFDLMTFRLGKRTSQALKLYNQSQNRARELTEVNMRLQAAQQQVIQSEKLASVGQLTAGIVHDVRNPLAVIKGMAEELTTTIEDNPELITDLSIIRDNADRANRIVADLLKFARQSKPDRRTQNLCDTALTALRLTHHLVNKASVDVESNLEEIEVIAPYDAQQLEQVFVNLIQNAIQAMPTGGRLKLHARQTPAWAEVSIQDTGTGIAEENLGRIFDPFFTTKPEGEGTGLGLSVCYGLISEHEGHIEAKSKLGAGTIFRVLLPRSSPPDSLLNSVAGES
ncbi:MAG: ATP-binding protein, partial [Anaerolineales bacterium]|nr:ATP-binding protein [Anaerolineales bacterium]